MDPEAVALLALDFVAAVGAIPGLTRFRFGWHTAAIRQKLMALLSVTGFFMHPEDVVLVSLGTALHHFLATDRPKDQLFCEYSAAYSSATSARQPLSVLIMSTTMGGLSGR